MGYYQLCIDVRAAAQLTSLDVAAAIELRQSHNMLLSHIDAQRHSMCWIR